MQPLNCIISLEPPSKTPLTPTSIAWHCTWSKDGNYLASSHGVPNPCVRIWKYCNNEEWTLVSTLQGVHERTIRYSSFTQNAKIVASASFDGTVSIWEKSITLEDDREEWECIAQLEGHENEVKCVIWNSSDTLLATCGRDKSVWIWECFLDGIDNIMTSTVGSSQRSEGDFDCIAVLHGHTADVKSLAFAPSHGQWGNGDEILLSSSYDDTIKCWAEDEGDWYCAATLKFQSSTIWSISLTSSGLRLVSACDDGSIAVWKCYTAKEKATLYQHDPDNAPGSAKDGLWKCEAHLKSIHKGPIYHVHCASVRVGHGRIASCGGDDKIQIYRELSSNRMQEQHQGEEAKIQFEINAFTHLESDVNCIVWHPKNGSLLASASDDGIIRIWSYLV